MVWTIEIARGARKELAKLDKTAADRILRFLDERIATEEDPRRFGECLTENLADLWKYRIGAFRVIAEIQEDRIVRYSHCSWMQMADIKKRTMPAFAFYPSLPVRVKNCRASAVSNRAMSVTYLSPTTKALAYTVLRAVSSL